MIFAENKDDREGIRSRKRNESSEGKQKLTDYKCTRKRCAEGSNAMHCFDNLFFLSV